MSKETSAKPGIIDEAYRDLAYIFGSERKAFKTMLGRFLRSLLLLLPVPDEKVEGAQTTEDLCTLWLDHRRNLQPNEPAQSSNEEYFDKVQDLEETELVESNT